MSNDNIRHKGRLFVISAPSGGGKSTIIREVLKIRPLIRFSVSATTRRPKNGEVEGREYHFLSQENFLRMVESGGLVEYEKVHENYYGTPQAPLEEALAVGESVILDLDVKGGFHLKSLYPQTALIFLTPPSLEVLRERIYARQREKPEEIEFRLKRIAMEIKAAEKFDFIVVNDDLDRTVMQVVSIIDNALKQ